MEGSLRLAGQRVLVVGLARSGAAAARLARARGARVTVTDRRAATELAPALGELGDGVELALGGHDPADFTGADLVVVSPGVPLTLPELQEARRQGVPVLAEVELSARLLPPWPIVGITGTNGKSTTTALAGELLARDRRVFVGGNLGTPLAELVLSGRQVDAVVLELSSYQLEGIERFRPTVAALLNITPDHLERHRDLEGYALAKARLFANQQPGDWAVANAGDPRAVALAGSGRGRLATFGFGPPAPRAARAPEAGGELALACGDGPPERYVLRSRALRGRHNVENAMAAALCARLLGAPGREVQAGLDAFQGLPHRLELVRERDGVEWVNDSKATNVDSTAVGLAAFPAGQPRVVLILGGRGKRAPYAPLRPLFPGRVKVVLTIGEDAPALARELDGAAPLEAVGTLAAAVERAAALGAPGDVVLLSPACASFDQFRSYEHRGECFRQLVEALP
ncbi:UDP-N-acetylmuramoyl-L-alanine--D-glutamate ligase [Anaeromyxobacter diazotrophicus]|uniref:UDP-N-acetylmuramoylalanine--D-glutamate ligase n=1 Tax=Anaeromyxobacter diazotrophicus TaxID=2590199 RepID=A0A7I9VK63_9BACT|nr:UDP-N-acetylmuramoyl-L-alanine--D-glutamate ligase [Anaeromyxobacter diazotrophicus]GEJ56773.1 UDP-N-acetylmuramoylalanine--D-glutamate ligase [Anaeromyxobacter diazotrophicus]